MPTSTDTYAVVQPDGTVTFDFAGHIQAEGLDMVATLDTSFPAAQAIRWLTAFANPTVLSFIVGFRTTSSILNFPNEFIMLEVDGPNPPGATFGRLARIMLESGVNDGIHTDSLSQLQVTVQDPQQNGVTRTVIRSDRFSDFLQLRTTEKLEVVHGSSVVTWPGGSNLTNTVVVPHTLGRAPLQILCTVTGAPGVGFVPVLNTFGRTPLQFSVNGDSRLQPAAGAQCAFDWFAIG